MTQYFRPVSQFGPARPQNAIPIAGGWCWACHVEVMERDRPSEIVPVSALTDRAIADIEIARPAISGISMDQPKIMGILNVTPDSFSDGGRFSCPQTAIDQARAMLGCGADIIDVGGESTRPGAVEVPVAQEIERTTPVIQAVASDARLVSIDTRKSAVAQAAISAGAGMVNDVSGLRFDPALAETVAQNGVSICLMHSLGNPEDMQDDPRYDDVLLDVYDALSAAISAAEAAGIPKGRIVVDPGIGFGKTLAHNLALIQKIDLFHSLGCPILLGASRKRFIGTLGDEPEAHERLAGSLAVALAGVAKGVQITRVHDVKQTRQAFILWQASTGTGPTRL